MVANHITYVEYYFWDARAEHNARMAYRASLALFEHVQGQIRACTAATIGIRPCTSTDYLKKAMKLLDTKFVTALSRAALVIEVNVQTVSSGLTYIATIMYVKSIRAFDQHGLYSLLQQMIFSEECAVFPKIPNAEELHP